MYRLTEHYIWELNKKHDYVGDESPIEVKIHGHLMVKYDGRCVIGPHFGILSDDEYFELQDCGDILKGLEQFGELLGGKLNYCEEAWIQGKVEKRKGKPCLFDISICKVLGYVEVRSEPDEDGSYEVNRSDTEMMVFLRGHES